MRSGDRGGVSVAKRVPERFFCTEGPIRPERHYHVPPLQRIDLDAVRRLIGQWRYFVLHAPRQTGKTTALLALRDTLNAGGEYRCVYVNVEIGQAAREDVSAAMRAILDRLALEAERTLGDHTLAELWPSALAAAGGIGALLNTLTRWAEADPKPIVLLIDEVDTLVGDTLIALLRQLRNGYPDRPHRFPQSVILCGVRDVRDYRIQSTREKSVVTGGSAFNVKATSRRLGDFSRDEVRLLLAQHTADTGQRWTDDAERETWALTAGQPWLVNALAQAAVDDQPVGEPVTATAIDRAREQLVLRRDTHLDQLADKLEEPRVRRVIELLLSGGQSAADIPRDDLDYVHDLGLIRINGSVSVANPIYREVIPRELTYTTEATLVGEAAWYIDDDGSLQADRLMAAFQAFFREHSEHWVERFQYKEAGPQLLLQAFLQRIVNSGGRIEREYGLGRMRTDLLIVWPSGGGTPAQRIVVECKLLHGSLVRTVEQGLAQTRAYLDRCGAGEGHLIIFDRTPGKPWDAKLYRRRETAGGTTITVWGM